jgi:hypothetical protein
MRMEGGEEDEDGGYEIKGGEEDEDGGGRGRVKSEIG